MVTPCRDGEVELVEVDVVAAPGKDGSVGGEDDSGDLVYGAGGAVVAGDPLGGGEGDGAGGDWDVDFGVIELAEAFGEVGGNSNGGRLVRTGQERLAVRSGEDGEAKGHLMDPFRNGSLICGCLEQSHTSGS